MDPLGEDLLPLPRHRISCRPSRQQLPCREHATFGFPRRRSCRSLHAAVVENCYHFWQELYSWPSARLESEKGAVALIVNQSWEKVRRPSTGRYRQHSCISLRLVHGSLARAGKVKSQTPKVEPQEKKKNPKGRAKKRMLYNRRYAPPSSFHCARLAYYCPLGLSMSPPYNRVGSDECEFNLS